MIGGVSKGRISAARPGPPRAGPGAAGRRAWSSDRWRDRANAVSRPTVPTLATAARQPNAVVSAPTTTGESTQPRLPDVLWALYARPSLLGWTRVLKIE